MDIFRKLWHAPLQPLGRLWNIFLYLLPTSLPMENYVLLLRKCHWLNHKTAWCCFNLSVSLHQWCATSAVVEVLESTAWKGKFQYPSVLWILLVLQVCIIFESFGLLHFRTLTRTQFLWDQVVSMGRFTYINLNLVAQKKKKKSKSTLEQKSLKFPPKTRIICYV